MDVINKKNVSNLRLAFVALVLVFVGEGLVSQVQGHGAVVSGSEAMELRMAAEAKERGIDLRQLTARVDQDVVSDREFVELRMAAIAKERGIYLPTLNAVDTTLSGSEAMELQMAADAKNTGIDQPALNAEDTTLSGSEAMELQMAAEALIKDLDEATLEMAEKKDLMAVPLSDSVGDAGKILAEGRNLRRNNGGRRRRRRN